MDSPPSLAGTVGACRGPRRKDRAEDCPRRRRVKALEHQNPFVAPEWNGLKLAAAAELLQNRKGHHVQKVRWIPLKLLVQGKHIFSPDLVDTAQRCLDIRLGITKRSIKAKGACIQTVLRSKERG